MDGNPISGLYPAPPTNQQQSLFQQNPLALIPAYMQLQQLGAQRAVGQAVQGAIGPNGLNTDAAIQTIKNDPNATLGALQGVGTLQQQRAQQIENDTKQFLLLGGQSAAVQNFIAGEAANPNATPDTVRDDAVRFASRNKIDPAMVNSVLAGMPATGGKAMQQFWANLTNATQGAAAAAAPTAAGVGPQGEEYKAPTGAVLGSTGGLVQTALPSGQASLAASSREELSRDQSSSAALQQGVRPLLAAIPYMEKLNDRSFGPQSAGWAKFKGTLQEIGAIAPNTADNEIYQIAHKYLQQKMLAVPGAVRSNEGLANASQAAPSTELTRGAALTLSRNQVGFDLMDAAKPIIFKQQYPNVTDDAQYKNFGSTYYSKYDPKAFSFHIQTPETRNEIIKSLGPKPTPQKPNPVYTKFMNSLRAADSSGVIAPQGGVDGGQ